MIKINSASLLSGRFWTAPAKVFMFHTPGNDVMRVEFRRITSLNTAT